MRVACLAFAVMLGVGCTKAEAPKSQVSGAGGAGAAGSIASDEPFPDIRDWNSVVIQLRRAACKGSCPAYIVQVRGDGRVDYCGFDRVAAFGYQTQMVPEESVRALVDKFKAANAWGLARSYVAKDVKDRPAIMVRISFDNRVKSIVDHAGEDAGMPANFKQLEDEIERVANTAAWVGQGGPAQDASKLPDCPSLGLVQSSSSTN